MFYNAAVHILAPKTWSVITFVVPNPDEPEPNRCMMSSQKTEVGHTLKSKMR